MFEKATRLKLKFKVNNGVVFTQDLWDLSLEELDNLAKGINKQIKESDGESYIKKKTTSNETLQLSFDVVLRVIEVKMKEAEEKKLAKEQAAKKARLLELINKKQMEADESKTLDELLKEVEAM